MTECTVGDYLLRRLKEAGVRHVFGVPGDFELGFLDQVEAMDGITWVGTCNELNAAYAADGHARRNGIAALVTTFGVGELSALNGLAGAYAEAAPVVSIVGTPPLSVLRGHDLIHHTAGDGEFSRHARCAREYTVAQAVLDRDTAAVEIDRALALCRLLGRPVYLMLPSDVAPLTIEAPATALPSTEARSDPAALARFADRAVERLRAGGSATILIGHEADRLGLAPQVLRAAEALGCPVACLSNGKGVFDEDHEQFAGVYAGAAGDPQARRAVEGADCLIAVGTVLADTLTGGTATGIDPARLIEVHRAAATVGATTYPRVTMADALGVLAGANVRRPASAAARRRPPAPAGPPRPGRLTQQRFWPRIEAFLAPGDIVMADQGTSYAGASRLALPRGAALAGQPLWGAIGYSLPALLGSMLAAPERRHVLIVGDGAFQQTAQELATLLRLGLTPVIVLVNNDGYTVERLIHGADAGYNDIARWHYDRLVEAFDPGGRAVTARATTDDEFAAVLEVADAHRDRLVFIEAVMDRLDAPETLTELGRALATADAG